MFERFTEKAIKVIMLAQEEARRLGHNFVGTEQILLGLIGEGTGIGSKALKAQGVNLKDARIQVENIIGRGSGFTAVEIPFTPRAKRVIEFAWQESRSLGHDYIGTEHLLLGLLQESEGVACRVLENSDIDFTVLKGNILKLINEQGTSASTAVRAAGSQTLAASIANKVKQHKPTIDELIKNNPIEPIVPSLEKFSDSVLHVFLLARAESRRLGHNQMGSEQLLIALIEENKGITGQILQLLHLDLQKTQEACEQIIGKSLHTKSTYIPFTPRLKKIFVDSERWASTFGLLLIKKEHILLALFDETEGVAARLMKNLSIDIEKGKNELLKLLAGQSKDD